MTPSEFLRVQVVEKEQGLRGDSGAGVEKNIAWSSGARWDEALVPFVQTGNHGGAQHREGRPPKSPPSTIDDRQCFPPGAKQQDAQHAVAEDVSAFANVKVPVFKVGAVHPEEKMQRGR